LFDGVEARMDPIPSIGQHTDSILAELGYTKSEIETLRRGAAV
jgi:crotonobetainyl-CoA:carnitine CoA-transferase CaiB-like acyl-CoA transferase